MVDVDNVVYTVAQLEIVHETLRKSYAAADVLGDQQVYVILMDAACDVERAIRLLKAGK